LAFGDYVDQVKPWKRSGRKTVVFAALVGIWLTLDVATKLQFADMEPGGVIAGPFLGLFDIRLVHNTGAAWGIFSDSTIVLGVFSLLVCVALTGYLFYSIYEIEIVQVFGFALVVAGGLGNAIDRFVQGYVVDFIEFTFMDFPVFNIADIGVTCGFVLVIIGMLIEFRKNKAVF